MKDALTEDRKHELIEKMRLGTIEKNEAEELKYILEKEQMRAAGKEDFIGVIVIGLMLISLSYLMSRVSPSDNPIEVIL